MRFLTWCFVSILLVVSLDFVLAKTDSQDAQKNTFDFPEVSGEESGNKHALPVGMDFKSRAPSSFCNNSHVRGLRFDTGRLFYYSDASVTMQPITVRLHDDMYRNVHSANEMINITAPAALHLTGVTTQFTNARGKATFDQVHFEYPKAGIHFLFFWVCGNSSVVEIEIGAGHPTVVKWIRKPFEQISSFGDLTVQPMWELLDNAGNRVEREMGQVKLRFTDHEYVSIVGNEIHAENGLIEFTSLHFLGKPYSTYRMNLHYTISHPIIPTQRTIDITYPEVFKVVNCSMRVEIAREEKQHYQDQRFLLFNKSVPREENFWSVDVGVLTNITVRGWRFDQLRTSGSGMCRLGDDVEYPMTYVDMCNVKCDIYSLTPLQKMLWVRIDTQDWVPVEYVRVIGEAVGLKLRDEAPMVVMLPFAGRSYEVPSIELDVVDEAENPLFWRYTKDVDGTYMHCEAPGIFSTKVSNIGHVRVMHGKAFVQPMLIDYPDPGVYEIVCNYTLPTSVIKTVDNYVVRKTIVTRHHYVYHGQINETLPANWTDSRWNETQYFEGNYTNYFYSGGHQVFARFNFTVIAACALPPYVRQVSGCESRIGSMETFECPTSGETILTLYGQGFGVAGSTVRIGGKPCRNVIHSKIDPFTILYAWNCTGSGLNNSVVVELRGGKFLFDSKIHIPQGVPRVAVHFRPRPVIESIRGCPFNYYPSTTNCNIDGSSMVQITGSDFGDRDAQVFFQLSEVSMLGDVGTRLPCFSVIHTSVDGTTINCTGFAGTGEQNAYVGIRHANGEETLNTEVTMSYIKTSTVPCAVVKGQFCNLKGVCLSHNGTCVCYADSARGFWTGVGCDICKYGYYGDDCRGVCPGGANNPCGGVARGQCDMGRNGLGNCTCVFGWGGFACSQVCPGGASMPCSGHGMCVAYANTPYCICGLDNVHGWWKGTTCASCDNFHTGAKCNLACPTWNGQTCNSRGVCAATFSQAACQCSSGWCGASCEIAPLSCTTCPLGWWGPLCTSTCPAAVCPTPGSACDVATICSGHGTCSGGPYGLGQCFCTQGYALSDCSVVCPGLLTKGVSCSGRGPCDLSTGLCLCNPGFAGADCGITCPGYPNVCSNNGRCNSGASGDGKCQCNNGYAGTSCNIICQGGTVFPCNLNGACSTVDGSCTCYADTTRGYWMGQACTVCKRTSDMVTVNDWYTTKCNKQCPMAAVNGIQVQCGGHGLCIDTLGLSCSCNKTLATGFWGGSACTLCDAAYYGPECKAQCPGGACNPCSKHGICFDGRNGNGTCKCHADFNLGFWSGAKCDECASGFWNFDCTKSCPRPIPNNLLSPVCNGHGTCNDKLRGDGLCTCYASVAGGFWAGTDCTFCASGFYGSDCTQVCPGTIFGLQVCSSHGTCDDAFHGSGLCTCDTGFGTASCGQECARVNGAYCSGHGECQDGRTRSGKCACYHDVNNGMWTGAGCDQCVENWFGPSCLNFCPGNGTCSGHGVCNWGVFGDGSCSCEYGYYGKACQLECFGGARNPCFGHGYCSPSNGTCYCNWDSTNGYWRLENCTTCDPFFRSAKCNVPCPTYQGRICNNKGVCYDGVCQYCKTGYCGTACELSGVLCGTGCDHGLWGTVCEFECPGGKNTPCADNGVCSEGKKGTGQCSCTNGWWGTSCTNPCPGGSLTPCYGHGKCSGLNGVCTCDAGYVTSTQCATACRGGAATPCFGHGTCDLSTGECSCRSGYTLDDCSEECPGGFKNPCSGHGTCHPISGNCKCQQTESTGFWNGTACSACKQGYFGLGCKLRCVNGRTEGRECICKRFWAGEDCTQPCPGLLQGGTEGVCSGHGNCTYGNNFVAAFCSCDDGYYLGDCSRGCTPAMCQAAPYFLVNTMCDLETGTCVCRDDNVGGHWTNPETRCTTCALFWWGEQCLTQCSCRMHGGCDQLSGACQCFDSDAMGHYTGETCDVCKQGFVGLTCKGRNVDITRLRPYSTRIDGSTPEALSSPSLLVDLPRGLQYGGGRPLVVFNISNFRRASAPVYLPGTVYGLTGYKGFLMCLLSNLDDDVSPNAARVALITRESVFTIPVNGPQIVSIGPIFYTPQPRPEDHVPVITGNSTQNTALRHETVGARKLQSVFIPKTPIVVASFVHPYDENILFMVYSTSAVTVIQETDRYNEGIRTRDIMLAYSRSFPQYFKEGGCKTATIMEDGNPPQIILGGIGLNNRWSLIGIELPLSDSSLIFDYSAVVPPFACQRVCEFLSCTKVVAFRSYLVFAANEAQGMSLLKINTDQSDQVGIQNTIMDLIPNEVVINVTAMIVDEISDAGFVAINKGLEPTVIYKFTLAELSVYGSVQFQKIDTNTREIVAGLYKDVVTRRLYALVPTDLQVSIIPMNLYAVIRFYPEIADTAGGTVVTVFGEGFVKDPYVVCDFNGALVFGSFVTARQVLCPTPVGGDERCEGTPLEVSIGERRFSQNQVKLRRVSSPRITSVTNLALNTNFGPMDSLYDIGVTGFGFLNTSYLGCRLQTQGRDDARYMWALSREYIESVGESGEKPMNAIFVNTSYVICRPKRSTLPTGPIAHLEVTLDGTVYSTSKNAFAVVGPAFSLSLSSYGGSKSFLQNGINLRSANVTTIKDITVGIVDIENHELAMVDIIQRNVTVELVDFTPLRVLANGSVVSVRTSATPVVRNSSSLQKLSTMGYVTFTGMHLEYPKRGNYTFRLSELDNGWISTVTIFVDCGLPHALYVAREPSLLTDNSKPKLAVSVLIMVIDISGNLFPSLAEHLVDTVIVAQYWVHKTTSYDADSPGDLWTPGKRVRVVREGFDKPQTLQGLVEGGTVTFENLELTGLHGRSYVIDFTASGRLNLLGTRSRPIGVKNCPDNSNRTSDSQTQMFFAKFETSECFVCPVHATCDGSMNIHVQDGYWRPSNDSYIMYSCREPYADNTCFNSSQCKQGYKGPRCSSCDVGYGRSGIRCLKCRQPASMVVMIIGYLLAGIVALLIITFLSLPGANDMSEIRKLTWVRHNHAKIREFAAVEIVLQLRAAYIQQNNLLEKAVAEGHQEIDLGPTEKVKIILCGLDEEAEVPSILKDDLLEKEYDIPGLYNPPPFMVPVLFKMLVNHVQVTGRLSSLRINFPPALVRLFQLFGSSTELTAGDISALECPPLRMSYYSKSIAMWAVPIALVIVVTFLILLYAFILGRRSGATDESQEERHMQDDRLSEEGGEGGNDDDERVTPPPVEPRASVARSRRSTAHGESVMRRLSVMTTQAIYRGVTEMGVTTNLSAAYMQIVIIILFLVYPSVLESAAQMWQCETLESGDGPTYKSSQYLFGERTLDCTSAKHQTYKILALCVMLAYGLGVPVVGISLVQSHWREHGPRSTYELFQFFLAGFRQESWFWECVILLRKACIICIVVFVSESRIQIYFGMWAMSFFFALHVYNKPHDYSLLYLLDSMSLTTIIITLNLALLYQFSALKVTTSFVILSGGLFLLNLTMTLILAYYFLRTCYQRFVAWAMVPSRRETWIPLLDRLGLDTSDHIFSDNIIDKLWEDEGQFEEYRKAPPIFARPSLVPNYDGIGVMNVLQNGLNGPTAKQARRGSADSADSKDTLDNEIDQIQDDIAGKKLEIEELQKRMQQLQVREADLQETKNRALARIPKLKEDIELEAQKIRGLEDKVQEIHQRNATDHVIAPVEGASLTFDEMKQQNAQLEKEIEKLKADMRHAKALHEAQLKGWQAQEAELAESLASKTRERTQRMESMKMLTALSEGHLEVNVEAIQQKRALEKSRLERLSIAELQKLLNDEPTPLATEELVYRQNKRIEQVRNAIQEETEKNNVKLAKILREIEQLEAQVKDTEMEAAVVLHDDE